MSEQNSAIAPGPSALYRKVFGFLSFGLYVVSFFLPAAVFKRGDEVETWVGWMAALEGLIGLIIAQFEFLANPLYLIALGLFAFRRWLSAGIFALFACALSAQTLSLFVVSFPANEGDVGPRYLMQSVHIGYCLWVGSMLLLAVAALIAHSRVEHSPEKSAEHI